MPGYVSELRQLIIFGDAETGDLAETAAPLCWYGVTVAEDSVGFYVYNLSLGFAICLFHNAFCFGDNGTEVIIRL